MKIVLVKKIVFVSLYFFLIIIIIKVFVNYLHTNVYNTSNTPVILEQTVLDKSVSVNKEGRLKYILRWTPSNTIPFQYMGEGQHGFIDRNCSYTNCFVTDDRSYLGDYINFDVIVFAGPQLKQLNPALPIKRSPRQKYVFASLESPVYYPMCSKKFDGFFNWTWTYKLNSDSKWGYFLIKDMDDNLVGPKMEMNWIKFEDMDPVGNEFKKQLITKNKAAAWFVSNCNSKSGREHFVNKLQNEMHKYNLSIDIYGGCGTFSCSKDDINECNEIVRDNYYFYLAFENSFSEDYVTEKLLTGLNYNTVPIVYGGANYTRFMPDGIYLNARELGVEKLAAKMNELIKNPEQYAEYFRWKKYYSYHDSEISIDHNDYCGFCELLFQEDLVNKTTVYHNFSAWWDSPGGC